MSSYGDLNQDLILNSNGNIYLVFRNKRISVLDSNGNLNVKIKNIIKSGTPGTNSDNGIYYDGNNVYIKTGNTIKNITGQQNSSQLPQGSIIRFRGNKNNPPAGWHYYGDTDMSGVIYIINMDVDPYAVSEVKLAWNPDSISTSLHDLGFVQPALQKQNPGNVPLSIEYSSDDPQIATIDGNGNITLKSAGSTNIKAITYANSQHNMSQASYTLTINKDEISAFFTQSSKTITVGESFTPSIIFKLNNQVYNGSVGDYYFTSNNSNVVQINGTNIIGKSEGTAKIKIHLNQNNWHDSFVSPDNSVLTLTVKSNEVAVESVTVSPSSFEVQSGGTQQLTATVLPSNATTKSVTWRVTQGNATINSSGKLTAGNVTTDTTVVVEAVSNDTSGSTRVSGTSRGTIKAQEPESNVKSFKNIIDEFNATGIYSPNITSTGTTGQLYSYLDTMYNNAKSEYEGNSELFQSSTYENLEVYNYHGTNNQYEQDGTAENAMFYWIIAMCLSELVPTSGSNNKQTRLFKFAYDLGKESGYGRKFRLYNNYTPKGDLTICRLVASVIYAKYRSSYKNQIPTFRSNLGGSTISISGTLQNGLNLTGSAGSSPTNYGYSVDLDQIFPAAAGPYSATGNYSNRAAYPKDQQGSDKDSFNNTTLNYTVDEAVNNEVITNYNLVNNSNSTKFKRTIQAISDDYEEVEHYLDDKIYYTYPDNPGNDVTYPHDRFTAATSSSNKGYFTGTFNNSVVTSKNLSLYKNSSNFTDFLEQMKDACAWNRQTTYWPQFGRKRPSQGETEGSCANSGQHSNQNWLDDWGILNLAGGATRYDSNGNKYYVDANGNGIREENESSYYPHNCSNIIASTYPSGHSGGVWGAALALIELLSDMGITNSTEINNIYKAAYAFTVSRTIVRAHWNSDTIYGKLNTTTIFPVLHAMSTFDNIFNNAKQDLNSTPSTKHNIDIAYVESFDGSSPALNGIKGSIFKQPTLYIKENNTTYTLDNYPYASQLKPLLTYKFYDNSYSSYASINSSTGEITLTGTTPSSLNTDRGIRIDVEVGNNNIFDYSFSPGSVISAHFYIKIIEQVGSMQIDAIIDNQTGEDAYITGEVHYFIHDSGTNTDTVVYTCSTENVANDKGVDDRDGDGEAENITLIKLKPGENQLHFPYAEYYGGSPVPTGTMTFRNFTANGVTEQGVRVYAHGKTAHEKYAFIGTITSGTEFKENNITYKIKIVPGSNYDLMYKPSTPTSSISVNPSSVSFQASGGTSSVSVTTNSSTWSATSGANWCTTNKSGNTLSISASANTGSRRTTTITITDGNNNTATVNISQSGAGSSDTPLYSVGLLSDIHYATRTGVNRPITTKSDGNNSGSTTGNTYSYYQEDLTHLIRNVFQDVDFIASPGDITEYNINDLIVFTSGYKSAYNNNPKPFYCATGNHDHGIMYCVGNTRAQDSNGTEIGDSTGGRWNSITYGGTTYPCPGSLATTISGLSKSDFYSGSKSYYISYKGDMYIFMMADYGSTNGMSDVHPHNMISSSQITTLKSKISNYTFPDNESNLNFQYYKYEDLIKLEELLRTNSSKRIFIFSHYFLPHKAGGGNKYQPGESTELMGITFHFLNYLNNTYTNTIWFSGHTHISWQDNTIKGLHWTNTNYDYIKPTSSDNSSMTYNDNLGLCKISGTNKIYNRNGSNKLNNNPTAWNIHLPSMSRPINTSGKQLGNCEAAIMRVYDDRVEIEKVGYSTSNGSSYTQYNIPDSLLTIYNDGTGECNDTAPEISGGGDTPISDSDGIAIRLINDLNEEVRLTGALVFNVAKNPNNWDVGNQTQVKASMVESSYDQYANHISIPAGGTFVSKFMQTEKYYGQDFYDENGNLTQLGSPSHSELTNGTWNMIGVESTVTRAGSLILYTAMQYGNGYTGTKDKSKINVSSGMYYAGIPDSTLIQKGKTFTYHVIKTAETSPWPQSMTLQPDMSGYYTILPVTNPISSAS